MFQFPDVLELNVGGVPYTTSLTTLVKGGDNMLTNMFSGRYHIIKDKDGRYFIDADGQIFGSILRYLRCGDLPCDKLALQVYREAKYFGLEELQRNIEQMPYMMAIQARLHFQEKLEGFDEALEEIVCSASNQQGLICDDIISYAVISLLKDPQSMRNPFFDHEHTCWKSFACHNVVSNLSIGPWKNIGDMEITDRVYLRAIARELEIRGFTVTHSKLGECCYELSEEKTKGETEKCQRTLYKIIFHWHKF